MSAFDGSAFQSALRRELEPQIKAVLLAALPAARENSRLAIEAAVRTSEAYASLMGGELQALFGLENPASALDGIVKAVGNSVVASYTPPSGPSLGGIRIEALVADMTEPLSAAGAKYVSFSQSRGTSTEVPWLEWLLTRGDSVVVAEFEAKTGGKKYGGTRTGKGVMVEPKKRPSRGFQVPPNFSGVVDKNWLTGCMAAAADPVAAALIQVLEGL